jgi:NAD-dependent dihydropyrimidine dehydrogenase PreA subunit
MSDQDIPLHYVCTRERARKIIDSHSGFWVSNCGCRESRGQCNRSRIDVCLQFQETTAAGDSGLREISRAEVEGILTEAEAKHLVTRPFRNQEDMTETDGICFCCDDCCGYFLDPGGYTCDKGDLIQRTDADRCANCGLCTEVCYFGARKLEGDKLTTKKEECYGCGLCTDVCPEGCIEMVSRV